MALLKLYWISDKDQLESAYLMSREQMKYCYQVVLQTAVSKLVLHNDKTSNFHMVVNGHASPGVPRSRIRN